MLCTETVSKAELKTLPALSVTMWRIAADDEDTVYLQNVCFLTQLCLSLLVREFSALIHRKGLNLQPHKVS
jgi:hypothetical protein